MRTVLYILLVVIALVIGFCIWFFGFFLQVPELNIPQNTTNEEKVVLIDNWFQKLNADKKFNGGVLFLKDGKPILAKTYGYTNYKKTERLDNNSSFRLASVSKQFTASGIMLLKERNALDYDDLVSKYITGFPYENVTVRHLLNQTSGVPDIYMQLAEAKKDSIGILTNKTAVNLIVSNYKTPNAKSNEVYEYSNTNYVLLARIIEVISDQSFEDFMRTNLFEPLGMTHTQVWNLKSTKSTFKGKTDGFEDGAGEVREVKPTFIDGVAGDGGVFSSINDFIIWDKFWYKNNLISDKNLKEAFKKPTLNNGELSNYGFGWFVVNDDIAMHNGAWLAANTYYYRNTKTKNSMVILDNSSNLFFDKIIKNLK